MICFVGQINKYKDFPPWFSSEVTAPNLYVQRGNKIPPIQQINHRKYILECENKKLKRHTNKII